MAPKKTMKRRTRTIKRSTKKTSAPSRSSLVNLIKSVTLKQVETKQAFSVESSLLAHNVSVKISNNLLATSQGVTDADGITNRLGDAIQPSGCKLYMQFRQPADRPNVTFKVWILKIVGAVTPPTFVPVKTITGNLFVDPIDMERVGKVVKSFIVKSPNNYWQGTLGTSKENVFFKKLWLPMSNQNYVYGGNNFTVGRDYQLAVYAAAYDTTSTLPTDIVAEFKLHNVLFFKDA